VLAVLMLTVLISRCAHWPSLGKGADNVVYLVKDPQDIIVKVSATALCGSYVLLSFQGYI